VPVSVSVGKNENDDEKDRSQHKATLKAVGRGSVRTGAFRLSARRRVNPHKRTARCSAQKI
jgi:hypothetical protein